MTESSDEAKDIEKLYEYGKRLNEAKDKAQHVEDYESIIKAATSNSIKARQFAAQLIPRFFKFFPDLSVSAVDAHLDLCEAEELGVSDVDHVDRLISCLFMALPFFMHGASNSKFLTYLNKNIFPLFDELPKEHKVDLLKNVAECSPYTAPQDARLILHSVVQLLKKYMPRRKTGEEMNFTYVECLLFSFYHLANKAPNATNSLCGYKIVTGLI